MPKENTHIYFADKVSQKVNSQDLLALLKKYSKYFYLGSISPDTFYYSPKKEVEEISNFIHGNFGNLTNELVFKFLNIAKNKKSEKDLVFALGFLTHCAIDIITHPVIFYLTGDYHSSDKKVAEDAKYLHRYFETYFDNKINKNFSIPKNIDLNILETLEILSVFYQDFSHVSKEDIIAVFQRHFKLNKLFKNDVLFFAVYFLNKIKILNNRGELALFYANLKVDKKTWPDEFEYKDLITGELLHDNWDNLLNKALNSSVEMLEAAYKYYCGIISEEECKKIIPGKSLLTNKFDTKVTDMRYFAQSK